MKILFLAPYPYDEAPSQRFRFEQYFAALQSRTVIFSLRSFYTIRAWNILYKKGFLFQKITGIIWGYFRRAGHLFLCLFYDVIFIHRELAPFGPPVFEWIILDVFRKKVIYDFDDAIWLRDVKSNFIFNFLKWTSKTSYVIRRSYKVSCGNEFLWNYAIRKNPSSVILPTTVDTFNLHNRMVNHFTGPTTIGWTGSHSTLKYLYFLENILQELLETREVRLLIICDQPPEWSIKNYLFLPWNKNTEIEDLLNIQIGLMPLPDNDWTRGKGGFKAIQYLALGIPALVSPVGFNSILVEHGVNGFHCREPEEWITYIRQLTGNPQTRFEFGKKGRKKIVDHFSTTSNLTGFLGLFE